MPKHKLYIQDKCSPISLDLGEKFPEVNDSGCDKSNMSKTPDKVLKRRSTTTTSIAKKIIKKKIEPSQCEDEFHPALLSDGETPKPNTSKNSNSETDSFAISERASPDSAALSNPDNDFDEDDDYLKVNQKLPYTYQEDEVIVKFVLKGQNIFRVSSLSLWKYLEYKKKDPKRTYQSLKNRFLRNIKPNLFTTYKHLIENQETVDNILVKFPELKKKMGNKKFLSKIKIPVGESKNPEEPTSSNDFEIGDTRKSSAPIADIKLGVDLFDVASPSFERTITLNRNLITVLVKSDSLKQSEVPFVSLPGLSERFKKLRTNNDRVPCPTCGKFYFRPVDWSESESDILIPDSAEREEKNRDGKSVQFDSRSAENSSGKINSSPDASQNLLISLEQSDKSDRESNRSGSTQDRDEIEVLDVPITEENPEAEEKSSDNDSDIDLIYEHTVARFHKLVGEDEDKTLQRKYLNKDRDSIGFNDNEDKNLDSFFLDTPLEVETPALTRDLSTQGHSATRRSQRVTRLPVLVSNAMAMCADKRTIKRKCQQ